LNFTQYSPVFGSGLYAGIPINKDPAKLWGKGFQHKESFYKYACGLVFDNAKSLLDNAMVVIDTAAAKAKSFGCKTNLQGVCSQ